MLPVGLDGGFAGGEPHPGTHKGAVVTVEVLVGHGHDILAGEGGPAFAALEPLVVAAAFGLEGEEEDGDFGDALNLLLAFDVGLHFDALNDVVAETALLDAVDAVPNNLLGLGVALEKEIGNVEDGVGTGVVERYIHVQCHEQTAVDGCLGEEAGIAAKELAEHVEGQLVGVALGHTGKNHHTHLDGGLADIEHFLLGEVGQFVGGHFGHFAAAPHTEFLFYKPLDFGGFEVAHEDERHIVGHIVGVEELLHLAGLWILEVLGIANDLTAVGVVAVGLGEHVEGKLLCKPVVATVLLLVDGLEFALEEAEDGFAETLYIHIHPVEELVGGESVVVDGIVVGGAGVEACAAHILQDGVDLVGDGVLRGSNAEPVDFELDVVPLLVVLGGLETVVGLADAIEIGFLLVPVDGADAVGTLEHDMFEIVSHTRGVGVLVLAACMDHHAAVDFGLAVLLAKDDFQSIVEVEGLDGQFGLSREGEHGKQRHAE